MGSSIGPKNRKDYTNILKLDIVMIRDTRERGDNNFNNSDNDKNYKKSKFLNLINTIINRRSLNLSSFNL